MGRNRPEAGTTNALVLLNLCCFVPWQPTGCLSPPPLHLSLLPLLRHFLSTLWFSAQSTSFRDVTADVRGHPGGVYSSWRCEYSDTLWRLYCTTHSQDAPKAPTCPIWVGPPVHLACPVRRVGSTLLARFVGDALVKWAIIPVGESDDDFWQNAATAPCQTIRAAAISSRGRTRTHSRARRLTPPTSCFPLRPQT